MTIHKAKGLEFPVVFIPYLNQKRKSNRARSLIDKSLFDAQRYIGNDEDDRRLYYVALTRAQKYLFLSGMADDPTVKRPRQPLKMISELDARLIDRPTVLTPPKSGYPPRKKFLHDITTNFSDLSAYGRCGYDYKLRHVYGYNAGVPVAFGYGTQIHNILNFIHSHYIENPLTMEEVEELVDDNFYLRFAPGSINEHLENVC